MRSTILASFVAIGLSTMGAHAATCSAFQEGGITPNSGCFFGETFNGNSGNDSPAALSADMVFGQTDWSLLAKDNSVGDVNAPDEGDSSLFSLVGSLQNGTMTIAQSVFDTYSYVAVVLKAGNANTGGWIAYDVSSTVLSYNSIFPTNNGVLDLSHISLYGTGTPTVSTVPLPAGGLLLLGGLGAFAAVKRRKKS